MRRQRRRARRLRSRASEGPFATSNQTTREVARHPKEQKKQAGKEWEGENRVI